MMQEHEVFAQLRDALSDVYRDADSASRMASDAGLDTRYIVLGRRLIDYWDNILREAELRGRVEALVNTAINAYPENQPLHTVFALYRAWVAAGRPGLAADAGVANPPATFSINDLQREALNPLVRVSDLLRKALVVAKKLKLRDFMLGLPRHEYLRLP